ncbi:MAG: exonuclease domain-containing protein [Bacteroidia bacterium]
MASLNDLSQAEKYTIIDIETTGGDPRTDRITEIAIYLHDGNEVIEEFVSLVNPERPIPEFITKITGINNDMVRDAPRFFEIAKQVVEITEGAVFVAHNVRFDYSFVQKEFRSLGFVFTRKQLCTVKLSRKLLPGHKSYSLGKLSKSLGIELENRHRAAGDAQATVILFEKLLEAGNKNASMDELIKSEFANIKLPPHLDRKVVEDLPDEVGVYYFHDVQGNVIYCGKSNHIRKRIRSHFQGAYQKTRTIEMFELVHDVSHTLCGNELIALLLENEEIKRLQPPFNRAQKRQKYRFAVYQYQAQDGYIRLQIGKYDESMRPLAGFANRNSAESGIDRRIKQFELCPRLCEREKGTGRCFYSQLHICKGACVGDEDPETYNERVFKAITSLNYGRGKLENFLVLGTGRNPQERSAVFVERGIYRGYTYLDESYLGAAPESLIEAIPYKEETPDVQRIIQGYIKKHPKEVFPLEPQPD